MELQNKIKLILEDKYLDPFETDESKCEHIENLIPLYGWEAVQEVLLNILLDNDRNIDDYCEVASVFWGATLDKRNICPNRVIALIYQRLVIDLYELEKSVDTVHYSNLAWSIASKLKNAGYLSIYEPLEDPDVIVELNNIRSENVRREKQG